MESISVVVITYNEERHIRRCIESVQAVADEIIVVDSFSTDSTASIARELGARVIQEPFEGYISQKNKALQHASHNYVLSLDADEALSSTLVESILTTKQSFRFKAYRMNRCAFYCGKFIRHGTWYPEPKLRLFDRTSVKWGGLDPHDRIVYPTTMAIGSLKGDILHYICETVEEHKQRSDNFSTIASDSLFKTGRGASWLKMTGSAAWFFTWDYFLRGGFLNGWRGWKIATIQARYHYRKYFKLRQKLKGSRHRKQRQV